MPPGSLEQVIVRMDVLGQWSDGGGLVVNSPRSLETAIDKYLTLARLQRAGLPVPATVVCQRWEEALTAFEALGEDVVVKPLFGGEGRGITRITDRELMDRAARMLQQLGAVLYLQRYVDHPRSDYRVFVVGRMMLGMRRSNPHDWRTNVSRGARAERLEITDQLAEVARRAVDAVGAEIAAVDILPDRAGKLWVLEVNAVPGWQALCKTVKIDVAQLVIAYLDQRWRDLGPAP
jgi:ribosomal protein S6--L-glutamate ligase